MICTDADDTDTLESLSQDSCSTLGDDEGRITLEFKNQHGLSSLFSITIQSIARIKNNDGTTQLVQSSPLSLSCVGEKIGTSLYPDNRYDVSLCLNRKLFRICWDDTPLSSFADHIRELLFNIPRHISNNHTDMYFHYRVLQTPENREDNYGSNMLCCTSVDIVDQSGKTFINNIHLHPFHRYHYQFAAENDKANKVRNIEVWTSRHAGFHISLQEPLQLQRKRVKRFASPKNPKKTEVSSVKSFTKPNQKAVIITEKQITNAELPKKPIVVFTSGIRLSRKDVIRGTKAGLLINPSFSKIHASPIILVVDKDLIRSVKLLTILPHTKSIVSLEWFRKVLDGTQDPCDVFNCHGVHIEGITQVEKENEFSLQSFLSVPITERINFFNGCHFWVHHEASPQEPPLNDLKTVIYHSGGNLTKSIDHADFLIIPPGAKDKRSLVNLIPHEQQSLSESKCFLVTPDHLFKSILQQDKSFLKNYPVIDFFCS